LSAPTRPVVLIDVVGLTPALLRGMPRLRALADAGFTAPMGAVLPAVTCTAQATMLTGLPPAGTGIVGNGWYFRDLGEVLLWRQHNRLVQGEKVWEAARRVHPGYTVANVCWWYAMGADTDWLVTPRPIYRADGRKDPDCYTRPAALHDELTARLGPFPLFTYWGPTAGLPSTRWVARAAAHLVDAARPDLTLVYLPHLDYDLQRYGPDSPQAAAAAADVDRVAGELAEGCVARGAAVLVVSEYGITRVSRPVDVNRLLRRRGWLEVHTQDGMEHLDPWASRAFAVADHQVAHVYVRDPADVAAVRADLEALDGVAEVLDEDGKRAAGLDHERAGELVAVAEADAWFTYYHWLDDARAPDYARTVEIHRKPGYDPAELFFDPADPLAKLKAGVALARKKVGLRYSMQVVPLDPSPVSGSHGRLPADPDDGPVLVCSDPALARAEPWALADVKALVLRAGGLGGPAA
jgi:predicted AlkP superfamily pyrophosphatase or phosphodiesterase